jgi:hypothetical protein
LRLDAAAHNVGVLSNHNAEWIMPALRWSATVDDSPGSEPFAVVGDLVVAVRTPRSHDFVTVEVAPTAACGDQLGRMDLPRVSSEPVPRLPDNWHGELHAGDTAGFHMAGASWKLTLSSLAESPAGLPWVVCRFSLQRG